MKNKISPHTEIPMLILNLVPLLLTLVFWNRIPEYVPVHWNINGEVDRYGPKLAVPFINLGIYLLLFLLVFVDSRKDKTAKPNNTIYTKIRWVLSLFFVGISGVILMVAMGQPIQMERFLLISLPLLFAMLGNFMLNIKPNWFMGVRTPWTMQSENVWRKTHRLTGVLWFWTGLACFVTGFFISPRYGLYFFIAAIVLMTTIPVVYSYLLFKKEKKMRNGGNLA